MKYRRPIVIFLLSITVLAFADSCRSKNVYGRRGGGGGRRGGCDCPSIGH